MGKMKELYMEIIYNQEKGILPTVREKVVSSTTVQSNLKKERKVHVSNNK